MPTFNYQEMPKELAAVADRMLANLIAFTLATARAGRAQPSRIGFPDEQLEYWGDFYVRHQLHKTGVRFEFFMQHPEALQEELTQRVRELQAAPRVRARSVPIFDVLGDDLVFLKKQAD